MPDPILPRSIPDISAYPGMVINGNSRTVGSAGYYTNLQTALDEAATWPVNQNHELVLQAGETFTGYYYVKPRPDGTGWILIRSSQSAALPARNVRVSPSNASLMPKIVTATGGYGALNFLQSSGNRVHHYWLHGIEARTTTGYVQTLVACANDTDNNYTADQDLVPHHIRFDHCYFHDSGDGTYIADKVIGLHGNDMAVIDSYITGDNPANGDSNAIWCCFGYTGPHLVQNCFMQAQGEILFFGGAGTGPTIDDVTVRYNYFYRPLAWEAFGRSKCVLEMKAGQYVLIEKNVVENTWLDGQQGQVFGFTPNSEDTNANAAVQHVTVRLNKCINVSTFASILQNTAGVLWRRNILFENNLCQSMNSTGTTRGSVLFTLNQYSDNIICRHNTLDANCYCALWLLGLTAYKATATNFTFTDNIMSMQDAYGYLADNGEGFGAAALSNHYASYTCRKNLLIGGPKGVTFPAEHAYPASSAGLFQDYTNKNYRISAASGYQGWSDGVDPGCDIDALEAAIAGVVEGNISGGSSGTIIGQSTIISQRPRLVGSGYVKLVGTSTVTAQRPRLTGAGTVSSAAITGYSAILASRPVLTGTGVVTTPITGVSAIVASRPVIASAGTIAITGQSAVVARRPVIVGAGGGLGGPSAVIAPRPRLAGVGEIYPGGIGGSSVIVAHRPYLTGAGEVIIPITGTSAVVAARPVVASAGTVAVTGTSAVTAGRPTLDGLGITGIGGSSEIIAPRPRITGTGSVGVKGQSAVLVPRPRLTGSGLVVSSAPEGTSSIIAQRPRLTGSGTVGRRTGKPDTAPGKKKAAITGTSAVHAQRPRLTGTGLVSIPAIDGESAVIALRPILTGEGTIAETSIDGTSAIIAARPVLMGDGLITLPTLYGDSSIVASRPVLAGSGEINAAPIDGTSAIIAARPVLTGAGFINIPLPVVAGAKFGAMYYELESFLMPYWIAAEARKAGPVTPPADTKRGSPLAVDPCEQECAVG